MVVPQQPGEQTALKPLPPEPELNSVPLHVRWKCVHSGIQRVREVSLLNLQYFGEELIVPSGALPLSFQAVSGGMVL